MKKILLSALPMLMIPVLSFSQVTKEREVIGSAGSTSSTASMEVSWTVGEVATNYSENPNLIVSEGFIKGNESSVGIEEVAFAGEFKVYPNPVSDELFYQINTEQALELTGALYDETGRLVMEIPSFKVTGEYLGELKMEGLSSGKWMLKFYSVKDGFTRTFNVIKVN